jgi:hypothetical protein
VLRGNQYHSLPLFSVDTIMTNNVRFLTIFLRKKNDLDKQEEGGKTPPQILLFPPSIGVWLYICRYIIIRISSLGWLHNPIFIFIYTFPTVKTVSPGGKDCLSFSALSASATHKVYR